MSKKNLLALILNLVFIGIMFAPTALADIAPPPDCKPGENPITDYCNPAIVPTDNPIPKPVVNPIENPVIPTPDKPEPEIKPEVLPEKTSAPETSKINPIIIYTVAGIIGVGIGTFFMKKNKKD